MGKHEFKGTEIIMPSTDWSAKRERQYQHIKDSALAQDESEPLAEEIAARPVNKSVRNTANQKPPPISSAPAPAVRLQRPYHRQA